MSLHATRCTLDPSRKPGRPLLAVMLLSLMALWAGVCPARAQLTRFQNFKGEQGLGNPAVEALAQDRDGFILLGTQAGLYRYDGDGILPYAQEALSEAYILRMVSDDAGRLWVVTNHGIFVRFESTFASVSTGRTSIHLRSAHLFAVTGGSAVLDLDGTILRAPVGANAVGRFEPLFDAATLKRIPALGKAGFVAPDERGALLVGCGTAVCRAADGRVTVLGEADGLPADNWQVALRTPDGTLWARSLDRLARRAPGEARFRIMAMPDGGGSAATATGSHTSYAGRPDLLDLVDDRHGGVLTQGADGLTDWDGVTARIYPHHADGLPSNRIETLMMDREGSVWTGSFGKGAFRSIGLGSWEHWTEDDGLPGSTVWSMIRLPNRQFWVSTDNGVTRLGATVPSLASETSYIVQGSHDGRLWLASFNAKLTRFDTAHDTVERFPLPARVMSTALDRDDRLWVGTTVGLFRVANADAPARDIHPAPVLSGDTEFVTTDPTGRVWVLSSGNVLRRGVGDRFDLMVPSTILKSTPSALGFAREGELWVGTSSTGVQRFRVAGDHVEQLPSITAPVIGSNYIVAERRDHRGWMWLGTDHGLDVFNGRTWRHFDRSDGLITNDLDQDAIYEDGDGSMWFGTSEGLSHLIDPTRPPPEATLHPLITGLSLGDRALPVRPLIRADWTRAPLVVRFVGLDYAQNGNIVYRYRLCGVDTGWSVTSGHEVRYADLPAGKLRFELIAVDPIHGTSSASTGFTIRIRAPWWRRWWFFGLCILVAILALVGTWRMRVRMLLRHQRRLEQLVGTRTAEIEQAKTTLERMALSDALTGLANRRAIMGALDEAVAAALGSQQPLAVLLCDIDHFKAINDNHGHLAGDEVLVAFGTRVRAAVEAPEAVGRYGGEEFLVILHGKPDLVARRVAVIHTAITVAPYCFAGADRPVTSSGGVAHLRAGDTALSLIARADTALYRAKENGRNRIEQERLGAAAGDALPLERRNLRHDLQAALENGEFILHYQPIVDLERDVVTSCEALLRWRSPSRGMVSPADFIPFAETAGLMPEIGAWVLRTACREAAGWRDGIRVSVNLSPQQLRSPDLIGWVVAALAEAGLPSDRLELEVTETAMIDDMAVAGTTLGQLRQLGITVALDDFGIGHSSLSSVIALPFDRIKIDRRFVQDLGVRGQATAIVRALIVLCETLGVAITAEGVESDRQIELLRAEGRVEVQGFRIGRPRPASEIRGWMAGFAASRSHAGAH